MLVEELSLRTRRVQPLIRQLEEMSQRMDELQAPARRPAADRRPGRQDRLRPPASSAS